MREQNRQLSKNPSATLLISTPSFLNADWQVEIISLIVVTYPRVLGNVLTKGLLLCCITLGWTSMAHGKGDEMLKTNNASIYYEIAGRGEPIVMIHAGVADSRQWNNEFSSFASHYQVIRYDMRGFGKSLPVAGEFSHLQDLTALLDHLQLDSPVVLLGCSMGGGLALDFALTYPDQVKALILVDAAPAGLEIDVPVPPKFKLLEDADKAGDLDLVAELETQIWFDGDRSPENLNLDMRALAYKMNRLALSHGDKRLGKRLPNTTVPASETLSKLQVPVLALIGAQDIAYMHVATDYMVKEIPFIVKQTIENAAHLPNMDQPEAFRNIVFDFLDNLPGPDGKVD